MFPALEGGEPRPAFQVQGCCRRDWVNAKGRLKVVPTHSGGWTPGRAMLADQTQCGLEVSYHPPAHLLGKSGSGALLSAGTCAWISPGTLGVTRPAPCDSTERRMWLPNLAGGSEWGPSVQPEREDSAGSPLPGAPSRVPPGLAWHGASVLPQPPAHTGGAGRPLLALGGTAGRAQAQGRAASPRAGMGRPGSGREGGLLHRPLSRGAPGAD